VQKDFAGIWLPLMLAWLVLVIPGAVASGIQTVVVGGMEGSEASKLSIDLVSASISAGSAALGVVLQALILPGMMLFSLKVARGQPASFDDLLAGVRWFWPMLGATLLSTLGIYAGALLCLVPGVVLSLGWWLYPFFIVDRGSGPVEALRSSWQLTLGHKGNLLAYGLLVLGLSLAGLLACCVGVFAVVPLIPLSSAFIYARLSGEPRHREP